MKRIHAICCTLFTLFFAPIVLTGSIAPFIPGHPLYASAALDNATAGGGSETHFTTYSIPDNSPPTATNVEVTGTLKVGEVLQGQFTYNDIEGDCEGVHVYKWYRYDTATGEEGKTEIADATGESYTLTAADEGKYISFEVTPNDGHINGTAVESDRQGPVVVLFSPTGGVLYVKKGVTGTGLGDSWANAVPELADVLKWAREEWDSGSAAWTTENPLQIWVATGKYLPTSNPSDREAAFRLVNGVEIYGGFPDSETATMDDRDWEAYPTILSGDIGGDDDDEDGVVTDPANINGTNTRQVVIGYRVGASAVLDGFIITAGKATVGTIFEHFRGGGIFNDSASPTLSNLDIRGNEALRGGGVANYYGHATMTNVVIRNNRVKAANNDGGGMNNYSSRPILNHVTITENSSESNGGGMVNESDSSPRLTNVVVSDNTAVKAGGGIYSSSGDIVLNNVTVIGNTANGAGGMLVANGKSQLNNVLIKNNSVTGRGGGIEMANLDPGSVVANLVIVGNSADLQGGGVATTGAVSLVNVVIANNSSKMGGGLFISSGNPTVANSIIWNNEADGNTESASASIFKGSTITPLITHSIVANSGGSGSGWDTALGTDGGNNWDVDPLFLDEEDGDYRLHATSPAINAGSNASYITSAGNLGDAVDFDGQPRLSGCDIDLGAFEVQGQLCTGPSADNVLYVNHAVNSDASDYTGKGDSWENAIPQLADALKWVREQWGEDGNRAKWGEDNPLQIWVAEGTYLPLYNVEDGKYDTDGGRDNAFVLMPYVQLYGGFAGGEESRSDRDWQVNETVLSGNIGDGVDMTDNARHVVIVAGGAGYPINEYAVMDGFTVTGGYASAEEGLQLFVNGAPITRVSGGGIYFARTNPSLANMTISANVSLGTGGGITLDTSSPILTNVVITGNSAEASGGGIQGGRDCSPVLTGVLISNNTAVTAGGGMYNYTLGSPVLTNVTIRNNTAGTKGGGIYNHANNLSLLTNVTIVGNSAAEGGGIHNNHETCLPMIKNGIVWGNGDSNVTGNIDEASNHNIIEGMYGHNLDTDPLFVGDGDYQLSENSPAINAGSDDAYEAAGGDLEHDVDQAGNPRVYKYGIGDRTIDIGAYEFQGDPETGVRYVKPVDGGGDENGDGRYWVSASSDLQAMIDELAAAGGGEVWVAKGIYIAPGEDGDGGFVMKNNVAIYGGFAGGETLLDDRDWEANETILSGNDATRVINNSYTEADTLAASAILDGFTVSHGRSNGAYDAAGVYNVYASPTFNNLIIRDNIFATTSTGSSGGMYNDHSSPVLNHVRITGNQGPSAGGMNNISSSPVLNDVVISGNICTSALELGGLSFSLECAPVLHDVVISGNQGIGLSFASQVTPTLINVSVTGNSSWGISAGRSGVIKMYNVTISGNVGGFRTTRTLEPLIHNTVIWGNGESNYLGNGVMPDAASSHNLIEGLEGHNTVDGEVYAGTAADLFADYQPATAEVATTAGNYQLAACSPAVNAGNNAEYPGGMDSLTVQVDAAGAPRLAWRTVDIGAFEYQEVPTPRMVVLPADSVYKMGDSLHFTVDFFRTIYVSGEPSIPLTVGGQPRAASFASLSVDGYGAVFSYAIADGDMDTDGIAIGTGITLNGGSIVFDDKTEAMLAYCSVPLTNLRIDGAKPKIIAASIASSNAAPAWAKVGDTVTVAFTASEIIDMPTVTVAGRTATVSAVGTAGTQWAATYIMRSGDEEGPVDFAIGVLEDETGNIGVGVSATTDESSVTFDKTMPVITGVEDGAVYNTEVSPAFGVGEEATLNGELFVVGTPVGEDGEYTLVVTDAAGNADTVNFIIDKSAPDVTGVEEGALYNTDVTPYFTEGTATLNGAPFTSGTIITDEDEYTLIVTDAAGNVTIVNFTVDRTAVPDTTPPTVSGLADGGIYNHEVIPEFTEGTATLNGSVLASGTSITAEGLYTLIVRDSLDNADTIRFEIDLTAPIVTGVKNGGIYNKPVTPVFDEGTATLNGQPFTSGTVVTEEGEYILIVTDAASNKTVVTFTISGVDVGPGVVPGVPTGLRAEAGNRQVLLAWDAPTDVFPAVTDYVIEYSRDGGSSWTVSKRETSTATRSLVIGLENNRSYMFRVSAVNGVGEGAFSGTVGVVPTEPVPDVEGNLPEPEPGVPVVVTNGKVEAVMLEVVDSEYLRLSGDGYVMELASLGVDGERIPISAVDAVIRLLKGNGTQVYVSGSGFEPGTVVTVYLFSNPELVGHLPVDADGRFGGSLPVPANLELGKHTLQANGVVSGGGGERSVSVGLELVDRKPQWVAFGALADRTYGEGPVTLAATASSGLAVSYTVTDGEGNPTAIASITDNRLYIHGAGDVDVTVTQGGNADYSAAVPVSRPLHIGKAPLSVRTPDATRAYGEDNPIFAISYEGFVNGDDAPALGTRPQAATEATATSTPGSYAISISGGESADYAFTYHGATLTVTKASQSITFAAPGEVDRGAGSIRLDVSSSSGLPVALTVDDPQVATLNGSTLDILRLGTVTVTATQAGDGNHEAAEPVAVAIRVVDPSSDFPLRVHRAVSPNGDGINEYLVIEGIRDYLENRVTVISRNGTVLWEAAGYDNDRVSFRGISTGQQQLPAGTYFYIVEVKVNGKWEYEKGYFVIRY